MLPNSAKKKSTGKCRRWLREEFSGRRYLLVGMLLEVLQLSETFFTLVTLNVFCAALEPLGLEAPEAFEAPAWEESDGFDGFELLG